MLILANLLHKVNIINKKVHIRHIFFKIRKAFSKKLRFRIQNGIYRVNLALQIHQKLILLLPNSLNKLSILLKFLQNTNIICLFNINFNLFHYTNKLECFILNMLLEKLSCITWRKYLFYKLDIF